MNLSFTVPQPGLGGEKIETVSPDSTLKGTLRLPDLRVFFRVDLLLRLFAILVFFLLVDFFVEDLRPR